MKQISVIVIGAGSRGITYSELMAKLPEQYKVVAIAEPIESRRNHVKQLHNIPDEYCFDDYTPLLALGKIADVAVICTMDRQHFEPAMMAIELGYDLLLEKPIAPTAQQCAQLTAAAEKKGVKVVICTVLRYTPFFRTLKTLVDSGRIGRVMSVNHEECVGNIHQTHSFVRGKWGNEGRSSNMLLQKSCHDLDILQWLIGKKCKSIQSFGTLSFFTAENAPADSAEYCVDCSCKDTCPYNALKLYYETTSRWFRCDATRTVDPSDEEVLKAISTNQYGRCVFKCDNDVVDHQTVNMLFEDDVTVTFSMNAFNGGGRFIHIMGTKGEIRAQNSGNSPIVVKNFFTGETEEIPMTGEDGIPGGHGGGDAGIVNTFYKYITNQYHGNSVPEISESCYNHMLVFAAEQSRLHGGVVDIDEFISHVD